MILSKVIKEHTHEVPSRNCTHANAWAIAENISGWSWYNLLYWVKPPLVESIVIIPLDPDGVTEDVEFTAEMFKEGGILAEEPLNHYLKVHVPGIPVPLMLNAGFLITNYLWGTRQGVATLKGLINRAKEKYWAEYQAAANRSEEVQATGSPL